MSEFLDDLCWEGLKAHPVPCPAMGGDTCHCPRLPRAAQLWGLHHSPRPQVLPLPLCSFWESVGVTAVQRLLDGGRNFIFHLILLHPGLQLSSLKSPRDSGRPQRHGNPILGLELTQLLVFITECLICPFLRKCDSLAWLTPAL